MFLKMCIFFDYVNVEFTPLDSLPIVIFTKELWIYIQCIVVISSASDLSCHIKYDELFTLSIVKVRKVVRKSVPHELFIALNDHIRSWGAQMHLWGFYCHFSSCNKNGGGVVSVLSLTSSLMFHMHIDNEGLYMIIIQLGL